jgi:PAS domain S-box-containing protein
LFLFAPTLELFFTSQKNRAEIEKGKVHLMGTIKSLFLKIVTVPQFTDEDDRERRRIVNVILLITLASTIFILLGSMLDDLLTFGDLFKISDKRVYIVSVAFVLLVLVLYWINRLWSGGVSASLLVIVINIMIPLADTPERTAFGRGLIAFAIPIALAALLIRPKYSYVSATFSSLILIFMSLVVLKRPLPNIPAIAIFYILAWITHDLSSGLRKALRQLEASYQKLQESENQYRGVFNGVNDAIIVETLTGSVLDVNENACKMFGWSREEFLQKSILDMVPPENVPLLPEGNLENTLPDETLETVNIRANGERFPVAVRGRVQEIGNEHVLLVVVRDITKAKEKEKELHDAKEAAEAAAQAKADFLANMSHEIRTPLNAIYGMTHLMLGTPLNDEQQDFIETIRSGSDTLLKVVDDILDFSKIEAGKMELEMAPFYIRTCVEEALDLTADKAAQKLLDLTCYVEDDVPLVIVGDSVRIRQILVNMLNNGIKFTEAGEVFVNVRGMLVEQGQYELTFSVRDTGIGIPKDKMDRLFKSFSQVDTSTTRKYGGTGLGLAISKQLAENMGGTIWVESEEGKGSTFCFTILVDIEDKQDPIYPENEISKLSGKRILIVDDNATNRLILTKQTQKWRMLPLAVRSGIEALALIEQGEKFNIAILDMQMPGMDGFTLAQEMAKRKSTANFPLIILTSIKREKARAGDAKISAFLSKPIKTSNLFNVLMKIIDGQPVALKKEPVQASNNDNLAETYPLKILLTEDNRINQKVATKLLGKLGYTADIANNGLEALDALKARRYDVVFMDIQMPEMDGEEATKHIREDWPEEAQPYIIAMTAHALEGDREKYLAHGMDDYVSKPIGVDALVAALKNAVQQ